MPSTIDELCRQLEERGEPYIRNFGDMVTWLYYSDPMLAPGYERNQGEEADR